MLRVRVPRIAPAAGGGITGTGGGTITLGGTGGVGTLAIAGTGGGTISLSGSATGKVAIAGTGGGSVTLGGTGGVGTLAITGTGGGTIALGGSGGTGNLAITGTGGGAISLTGGGTGKLAIAGTGGGTIALGGSGGAGTSGNAGGGGNCPTASEIAEAVMDSIVSGSTTVRQALAILLTLAEDTAVSVLSSQVETGATVLQSLRLHNAVLGGDGGTLTTSPTFKSLDGGKTRVASTLSGAESETRTVTSRDLT